MLTTAPPTDADSLYQRLQDEVRKTAALTRIAAGVALADPLDTILNDLARNVVEAMGAVACTVLLMDADAGLPSAYCAGSYGQPDGYVNGLLETVRGGGRMLSEAALERGRPYVRQQARAAILAEPVWVSLHAFAPTVEWDTLMAVPLFARGRRLGTLTTYYRPEHEPSDDKVAFLSTIADHAAVAAENARLYEQAQRLAALEERQRLARELHDSVSQTLFGLRLTVQAARGSLGHSGERTAELLDYVLELAEAGIAETRSLIMELRPEVLERNGLIAALVRQADMLRVRHALEVAASLCEEPDVTLPVKEAIYRIAQEALHNVVKHAAARRVDLRLAYAAGGLTLEVCDDGAGFDPAVAVPGHVGQQVMRERAAGLGGDVVVTSSPGRGTHVRASFRTAAVKP
jgi:signal transduction histidine kinase